MMDEEIKRLRDSIDRTDQAIRDLLNQRARLAQEIGKLKASQNLGAYVPSRERQVLERLTAGNAGPLTDAALRAIYREIMSACRALEKQPVVVFLGPAATFTQMACQRNFGSAVTQVPVNTIPEVFAAVEREEADYGVIPIENSTEGVEAHTLDMFTRSPLLICAEVSVEVHHCLMSRSPLEGIRTVYSHPQGLAQCRNWLQAHLSEASLAAVSSTARGAEIAAEEPGTAAIATSLAAELYGLDILADHIEDLPGNRTRFLVVGRTTNPPSGKDKTSLMFATAHRPGSLFHALGHLQRHEVNMTMIQSRPSRLTSWEYVFFVDCQGHISDPPLQRAVEGLREVCYFVKVLGSYPEAE